MYRAPNRCGKHGGSRIIRSVLFGSELHPKTLPSEVLSLLTVDLVRSVRGLSSMKLMSLWTQVEKIDAHLLQ